MNKEMMEALINWFFNDKEELPDIIDIKFIRYVNTFIYNFFIKIPKMCYILDKYDNENKTYWNVDPIDRLKFLKYLIKNNDIGYNDLHTYKSKPSIRCELKKNIHNKSDCEINFIFELFRHGMLSIDDINSMMQNNIEKSKMNKDEKNELNKKLSSEKNIETNNKIKYSNPIKEISEDPKLDPYTFGQDIVYQLGLQLFDIQIINKTNTILYIFIDKNGDKKTLEVPYMYKFYISRKQGILNNDYFEPNDMNNFDQYICVDTKMTKQLQMELNKAYERDLNLLTI